MLDYGQHQRNLNRRNFVGEPIKTAKPYVLFFKIGASRFSKVFNLPLESNSLGFVTSLPPGMKQRFPS